MNTSWALNDVPQVIMYLWLSAMALTLHCSMVWCSYTQNQSSVRMAMNGTLPEISEH